MKVLILVDYKGFFGSKQDSKLYRGGMDIQVLAKLLKNYGYEVEVLKYCEFQINFDRIVKEAPLVLYQSSEDKNSFYKAYIEDIIFDLEQRGIKVIPSYACLKAHNNKSAMELFRSRVGLSSIETIKSMTFGTLEEILVVKDSLSFPVVVKPAWGAQSSGVELVNNEIELIEHIKKISSTSSLKHDVKELLRQVKYRKKYIKESFNRNKYIIQEFIPNLSNDWKVLVYGNYAFALYRQVRDNDFRASGSGKFIFKKDLPPGMLDFALSIRKAFNVPHVSLDIAYDGNRFHLIEFQFLNFGTVTLEKSSFYFLNENHKWKLVESKSNLETIFTASLVDYLSHNQANSNENTFRK